MINYGDPEASIIKAFRNRGYRATPQRIAVSRYILSNHEHPTAQKAYLEVKKTHPTVSLATVYSTIRILKEMGLVMELNLSQGETRYDPNTEAHAHLLCIRCGCLIDWSDPIMGELISKVSAEANFTVIGSSMDLKGICDGCGEKEGSPPPRAAANDSGGSQRLIYRPEAGYGGLGLSGDFRKLYVFSDILPRGRAMGGRRRPSRLLHLK